MYKILHAKADFLLCSFEFENVETGEHIYGHYFDDPLYDLLALTGKQWDWELEGIIISDIPEDLRLCTKEFAEERAKRPFDGAWLFPWLRKKK